MINSDTQSDLPEGFEPIFRSSPFLDMCGPMFYKRDGQTLVFGMRIVEKHTNSRGFAHGGLLTTLCDIALGYSTGFAGEFEGKPPIGYVTIHMDIDFAGAAKIGDWLEARADIQKRGSRMAFANAYVSVSSERIVRASAVFAASGK